MVLSKLNSNKIHEYLNSHGFIFCEKTLRSDLYVFEKHNEAILIDRDICNSINPFHYAQYTKEQNLLMYKYNFLYRFVIDDEDDFLNLKR